MSNETKAQLKYYLDHGSSPTEIARILHISRQSVYNYKKKESKNRTVKKTIVLWIRSMI